MNLFTHTANVIYTHFLVQDIVEKLDAVLKVVLIGIRGVIYEPDLPNCVTLQSLRLYSHQSLQFAIVSILLSQHSL